MKKVTVRRYKCNQRMWANWEEQELEYRVEYDPPLGYYVHLIGGSTGYESISIDLLPVWLDGETRPWAACVGTLGAWDRIEVPASEMLKIARDVLGEQS